MAIKVIDQQRLDTLYAEYRGRYGGTKEDYFALLYMVRKFKVDVDEVAHKVAFRGNDYGVDAYFLDRDAATFTYFSLSGQKTMGQFKGSMERLTEHGLDRIFGNPKQDRDQNELLSYLKKELKELKELVDRVFIHFVFKGDVDSAEKSEGLSHRREDIESKAHLIRSFFDDRDIELQVDFISDKPGQKGPPAAQSYIVHLREAGTATHKERTMHLGFVSLMDLYAIYKALGQQFFDRNIRAALSPDNARTRRFVQLWLKSSSRRSRIHPYFAFATMG